MLIFKILISGSRNFTDYNVFKRHMDKLLSKKIKQEYEIIIISGHANGVDSLAEKYASENQFINIICPAQWNKYGKKAGYIRNKRMLDFSPDAFVAFWNKKSKGTKNMIDEVEKLSIPSRIIYIDS